MPATPQPQNIQPAFNYLTQNVGLTPTQAAGAVNWLYNVESGLDPNASNSIGAVGIAQWLGSRKDALFAEFGSNPTFDQQLTFLGQEIQGADFGGPQFTSAASPDEQSAFSNFGLFFERPSSKEFNQATAAFSPIGDQLDASGVNTGDPTGLGGGGFGFDPLVGQHFPGELGTDPFTGFPNTQIQNFNDQGGFNIDSGGSVSGSAIVGGAQTLTGLGGLLSSVTGQSNSADSTWWNTVLARLQESFIKLGLVFLALILIGIAAFTFSTGEGQKVVRGFINK